MKKGIVLFMLMFSILCNLTIVNASDIKPMDVIGDPVPLNFL